MGKCVVGNMGQLMWIDQGQGLLTALTMSLLANPTARLIVFMTDVFEYGTIPTSPDSTATATATATSTNQHVRITPSVASLQRANAAVQVTPLV